jgi:ComF family protein
MLRDLWDGLLDLLSPPCCLSCESPLRERADGFCEACAPLIDAVPEPRDDALDRAAFVYGGPLAEAIAGFKYRGRSDAAPCLSAMLTDAARPWIGRVSWVAVVPLHPRRLRERGYNQSALLARPLARFLGAQYRPHALRRLRDAPPQVGADPLQRQQQLHGAFAATPAARGKTVLVVDDVRTTGATLAEARRALSLAGAAQVYTLTLAERSRTRGGAHSARTPPLYSPACIGF